MLPLPHIAATEPPAPPAARAAAACTCRQLAAFSRRSSKLWEVLYAYVDREERFPALSAWVVARHAQVRVRARRI